MTNVGSGLGPASVEDGEGEGDDEDGEDLHAELASEAIAIAVEIRRRERGREPCMKLGCLPDHVVSPSTFHPAEKSQCSQ